MRFWKKKEVKPNVVINSIIKPIKVKKNEKVILVVGDEYDAPSSEEFSMISKSLDDILDCKSVMIPGVIRLYIVQNDCKIELYRGDKLDYES